MFKIIFQTYYIYMNLQMSDLVNVTSDVLKQSVALWGLQMTGLPDLIVMQNDNFVKRNLKRGLMFYASDQLVELASGNQSNLTNFSMSGLSTLIDDTVFYSLCSGGIETLRLDDTINNYADQYIPLPSGTEGYVVTSALLIASKRLGRYLEDNNMFPSLMNASTFLGLK